jgi:hypothetical protein
VNPSYRLEKLNRVARRRITKLRSVVRALSLPLPPEADRAVAWAIIEALNVWASFLRAYYLSAAIHAKTRSGTKIALSSGAFPDAQAALKFAVQYLKDPKFKKSFVSRRDEPTWHNTSDFLKLLRKVGASNILVIQAGLAYRTTFFIFLPTIRNFYAHRCDDTSRKAGNVGVKLGLSATPNLHATEIMCSTLPRRPQNIATDWLDDIGNVIDLLCS